jgi:hypothetical protein
MEFRQSEFEGDRNIEHKELRFRDMRNRESAFHIKPWSQLLVTGREGVKNKLHIGVSRIAISRRQEHNATEMSKSRYAISRHNRSR